MRTAIIVTGALLAAPLASRAATQGATVITPGAQAEHLAWRQDPPATGALAVHPGDRVVTGRLATRSGEQLVVESDFGGTETLAVTGKTRGVEGARVQDLHTGDVVSVAYHGDGQRRTADAVARGDHARSTP